MGVFDKFSGIGVASGFKLQAKAPLDPRQVVDTIDDRNALITENGAYEGMQVYVKADKKTYCLKDLTAGTWEEVGAGGGSSATLPNNIISETIVLTPENVKSISSDSFSFVFTAAQTAQCLRANVIFLDGSALGADYSTFITMPLLRFDAGFLNGDASNIFYFASGDIGGLFMINVIGVVQEDGSSEVEVMAVSTEPDDQYIPIPPNDDYKYSLVTFNGITEWRKSYETSQITLLVSEWNVTTKTQNVNSAELHDDDLVIVSPTGDPKDYADAGIYCSGQDVNNLTFTCETIPTKDIVVNIVVF